MKLINYKKELSLNKCKGNSTKILCNHLNGNHKMKNFVEIAFCFSLKFKYLIFP